MLPAPGNIWDELVKAGQISAREAMPFKDAGYSDDIVARLQRDYRVFVAGRSPTENFDTLIEGLVAEDDLPAELRVKDRAAKRKPKVLRAIWIADNRACPAFLRPIFHEIRRLAGAERRRRFHWR